MFLTDIRMFLKIVITATNLLTQRKFH